MHTSVRPKGLVALGVELSSAGFRLAVGSDPGAPVWRCQCPFPVGRFGEFRDHLLPGRSTTGLDAMGFARSWRQALRTFAGRADTETRASDGPGPAEVLSTVLAAGLAALDAESGGAESLVATVPCTHSWAPASTRELLKVLCTDAGLEVVDEVRRMDALVRRVCSTGVPAGHHVVLDPSEAGVAVAVVEVHAGGGTVLATACERLRPGDGVRERVTLRVLEGLRARGLPHREDDLGAIGDALDAVAPMLDRGEAADLAPALAAHGVRGSLKLTRDDESWAEAPLCALLISVLDRVLDDTGVPAKRIGQVFVAGERGTRAVLCAVMDRFGVPPQSVQGMDTAAVLGAAQLAAEHAGLRPTVEIVRRAEPTARPGARDGTRLSTPAPAVRPSAAPPTRRPPPAVVPSPSRPPSVPPSAAPVRFPPAPRAPSLPPTVTPSTSPSRPPSVAPSPAPSSVPSRRPSIPPPSRPSQPPGPPDPRDELAFEDLAAQVRRASAFDVLGVHWSAPEEELFDAYRTLTVRLRPGGAWEARDAARVHEMRDRVEAAWASVRTLEGRIVARRRDHPGTDFVAMAELLRHRVSSLQLLGKTAEADRVLRLVDELMRTALPR